MVCELVKVLLKLLLKGTTTAFVGDFANFVVGCTLILPAAVLYHAHRTRGYAIAGMALGTVCMTVFGSAFNAVYLLPRFAVMYGISLDAIVAMGQQVNASITSVRDVYKTQALCRWWTVHAVWIWTARSALWTIRRTARPITARHLFPIRMTAWYCV